MKLSPTWLRDFVDLKADNRRLAEDLTSAGIAVEGISGDGDAMVFEMEITPNRPDAMNHYGVARECSAIYDVELKPYRPSLPAAQGRANFPIEIEDAVGCARYTGQVVRDVKIKSSPAHIARRLDWVEQRPINNAADATNYTLWEIGHPTHAFDLDLLEGKIIVRRARAGETLKTLDGVDRKLSRDDLVIADARRPVALAGVMGGFDTMITERTRNVLIEAAWFDPASVRRTSRRHGMHTDASHRFERGADWAATPLACGRVAQLVLESGGGHLAGGQIDTVARKLEQPSLALRRSEVQRILGQDISENEIERILRRLGFRVTPGQRSSVTVSKPVAPRTSGGAHAAVAEEVASFTVEVPSWRLDVEREIDLIEEVARLHGFDNFPNTLPAFSGAVVELPEAAKDAKVRSTLLALGYNEAVSLSFISHEDAKRFSSAIPVEIANPLSEEASVMRTSLLPGMLNMLGWNLNRGINDVRLFECGNVFELNGARSEERCVACIGATGNAIPANVHESGRPYSFFDLKGDVESLLSAFAQNSLYFDEQSADYYRPGRSARAVLDGATVARFGQLHPEIAAARKMRQDVFLAEIFLDRLYKHSLRQSAYKPLPRYPAVERDFSFIFDDAVTWERVRAAVEALHIPELRSFVPAEIFRGGAIPSGRYSLLSRARFQSDERTLREDEVAQWSAQIIQALQALGGTLRAT